jgi:hypothetical protein
LQDRPKCTQIVIFGMKINHLATLHPTQFLVKTPLQFQTRSQWLRFRSQR